MSSPLLPLAIGFALVLAAVAVSLFGWFRSEALVADANKDARMTQAKLEAEVQAVRQTLEALAVQVQEAQQQARQMAPALPRPGLNLTRRSQALRMHRRGESTDQIAASLEIPRQEVDLLLKVHRIVIGSVT